MEQMVQSENNSNGKVDAVDKQILTLLQEDCTLSFNKIASQIAVSVGTAYNRIKSLEAKGLIKGYAIRADLAKLGYKLTAVIMVQAETGYLTEVENALSKDANVVAVYDVTGEYDAALVTKFKDRNNLNVFIKSLTAMPNVKRTLTNVVLTTVKEDFRVNVP